MSTYVNVIATNPAPVLSDTSGDITFSNPGVCILWSNGTINNSPPSGISITTNTLSQSTQVLKLDGYSCPDTSGTPTKTCTMFTGILNFTLDNPIFTDDETDVVYLYVVFPTSATFNSGTTFNITCSLSNLGSMVSSPVYPITSTTTSFPYIVVPINKWFSFRAPGSIYQIQIQGFST